MSPLASMGRVSRLSCAIASLGGLGRFPIAPATAASAVIAGLYFLVPMNPLAQAVLLVAVTAIGVWSAGIASAIWGEDPSRVVIDEAAGMLVASFMLPQTAVHAAAAFALFRIFDIGKWFPMRQLESLPGGWGIVADDLAAGLLARLVMLPWT